MLQLWVVVLLVVATGSYGSLCPPGPDDAAEWRLLATMPPGCNRSDCQFYLAIRTNDNDSSYLDFAMEANAMGWLAVGFAPHPSMPNADVFACVYIDNMTVEVLDTHNPPEKYTNEIDTINDLCVHTKGVNNSRVSCLFSRAIKTNDSDGDKYLDKEYYMMFGAVDASFSNGSTSLSYHVAQNPYISTVPINPANSSGKVYSTFGITGCLTRVHGILMVAAWPMMAATSIFFAVWMRPALPASVGFLLHRSFAMGSMAIAIIGFVIIFIANMHQSTPGLIPLAGRPIAAAHLWIGIAVMFIHVFNPLLSIFRCPSKSPRRWIYSLVHGLIVGVGLFLLAMSNVAIGLYLYGEKISRLTNPFSLLSIFIAYAVFVILLNIALFVLFTLRAFRAGSEEAPVVAPLFFRYFIGRFVKPTIKLQAPPISMVKKVSYVEMVNEGEDGGAKNTLGGHKETDFGGTSEARHRSGHKEGNKDGSGNKEQDGHEEGDKSGNEEGEKKSNYFTDSNLRTASLCIFLVAMVPLTTTIVFLISI